MLHPCQKKPFRSRILQSCRYHGYRTLPPECSFRKPHPKECIHNHFSNPGLHRDRTFQSQGFKGTVYQRMPHSCYTESGSASAFGRQKCNYLWHFILRFFILPYFYSIFYSFFKNFQQNVFFFALMVSGCCF